MTFPQTALNSLVEIDIDGVWTNVTSYVMRDPITITRGRADESSLVEASSCTMTLNNRDGRFSPRNPGSPYFGILGRNTPIRVSLPDITGTADDKRFTGEVSAWPQKWDKTGTDVFVPLEAAGVLRRFAQSSTISLPAFKDYLISTNPRAYWPLDDATTATSGASATPFNTSQMFKYGNVNKTKFGLGDLGETLSAGVKMNGSASGASLKGEINSSNSITDTVLDFVFRSDALTAAVTVTLTQNSDGFYTLTLRADGTNDDLRLQYTDPDGTTTNLGDTAALTIYEDAELHHIRLSLVENGANVDWTIYVDGTSAASGTHSTASALGLFRVGFTMTSTSSSPFAFGHVVLWNTNGDGGDPPALATVTGALAGYDHELAADRISRVCSDAGISFTLVGTAADTALMGPQPDDKTPLELIRECEAADRGILYEPRDSLGLVYRTRANLYNQTSAVDLDYSASVFSDVPEPVDDDQRTRNDVTMSRDGGGSATATLETGPLSVLAPPDGVGRYQYSESVNMYADDLLAGLAGWLMNLGTIDKARYPSLPLALHRNVFASNATLTGQAAGLDVGEYLTITDLPAWLPPDDVALLAQGFTETLHNFGWDITVNCVPGDLYQIPKFEAATPPDAGNERARFDSEGATLAVAINTTATSLTVDTTWTAWNPADAEDGFDILIGGERMTVTDITALTGDDHTFTVTRSVNGIVKSHSIGAEVRLFLTPTFGL